MKKIFILICAILLSALVSSCQGNERKPPENLSDPIESYDNVSVFTPEKDESQTESTNENTENSEEEGEDNGLVVKDKKYEYKGKNVVILNVKNQTNKNYSLTVKGIYLDKNGNVLKTETQSSDQYSAGYNGYFLFDPDTSFEKFTYTLETKKAQGPFYAKDIVFSFNGLNEWKVVNHELLAQGDRNKYPHIVAGVNIAYKGTEQLFVKSTWVFINESGVIAGIAELNEPPLCDPDPVFDGESHLPLFYTKEEKLVWPEEFKGTLTAILIIREIKPYS